MRSKGFQNIINNKKYKTLRLKSGYREIRNHVLNSFKEQRKIFSMSYGKEAVLWGIQFAYPQIYFDNFPKVAMIINFPNFDLMRNDF